MSFPGGLVARIRRFHRRGPGSIPGQGSLSSSSLAPSLTPLSPFGQLLLVLAHFPQTLADPRLHSPRPA